jgi:hypothetical protein
MEGAAKIMHLIIPLLLMVAEGKCDFQLLLQYSPEKYEKNSFNPTMLMWEST